MPVSFPDGVAVTSPPASQVSQAKEDTTDTPRRCFVCLGNPAELIPIGGHLGQVHAFCSERCAAIHGLRVFRDSKTSWCNFCSCWTEESGTCHNCGKRWVIAGEGDDLDDGPFAGEEGGMSNDA